MIRLTRLNGRAFVLNAERIQYLEETPDTVITLVGGEKVMVQEQMDAVIERAVEYGRSLRIFPVE